MLFAHGLPPGSLVAHPEVPPVTTVTETEGPPIPAPRADAARNRRRLLDAALAEFTSAEGPVALETIARTAGVGIGTLYRHFPSREALVEAVYRSELERLCRSADDLLADLPPDAALRAWMRRYADFVTTKRGMAEALRAVIATGAVTSSQTRERLAVAVGAMLARGGRGGPAARRRACRGRRGEPRGHPACRELAGAGRPDARPARRRTARVGRYAVARCATGMPVSQGSTRPNCTSSP